MKVETLASKLLVLDKILLYGEEETSHLKNTSFYGDINVSQCTLAIARRVPNLLSSDLVGNISIRATSLRYLLFGKDSSDESENSLEDKAFARVVRRCPELLLLDVERNIAPKLKELSVSFNRYIYDSNIFRSHSHFQNTPFSRTFCPCMISPPYRVTIHWEVLWEVMNPV